MLFLSFVSQSRHHYEEGKHTKICYNFRRVHISAFSLSGNGCVGPGSALGKIGLSGAFSENERFSGLRVKVVLPETYGLEGLDRIFGKPSGYGNKDPLSFSEVDEKGGFFVSFDPMVYHASFCRHINADRDPNLSFKAFSEVP